MLAFLSSTCVYICLLGCCRHFVRYRFGDINHNLSTSSFPPFYPCVQGAQAGGAEPVAPPPPRSIDVRVWVTRPHIAVLEFPLSPNTSALLLEGEQGVYYRWQSLIIAQVRLSNNYSSPGLN